MTHPIQDDAGNLTQIITGTRDITAHVQIQRELENERDLLEKIMDTSPSGISVVDKTGQLVFANRRSEEILRLSKKSQLERNYDSAEWKHTHYDGTPWPDEKQPFVRVMKTGEPVYNVQHAIESPDGHRILLSINGAPLFDEEGEIDKVVFTIEDVTEIKRAESSLHELLKREQEITSIKSRFLSIVSHEFRTPLSVILTAVDLMERQNASILNAQSLNRLSNIRQEVKYLDIQLDEISSFNRSNHSSQIQLNPERTHVVEQIHELIHHITRQYPTQSQIIFNTPHKRHEAWLLDPQLTQHIFTNLISNAVKYSKDGGDIIIDLICSSDELLFKIVDHGIGIPEEDQDKLFNFFYRADNVGSVQGTGIGLAVVKQSVLAHGGQIHFSSQLGEGSTFTVTLPIKAPRFAEV